MPASEREMIAQYFSPAFTLFEPSQRSAPFVLCSPHSGRVYPESFIAASNLDPLALRKSEDCDVDELFKPGAARGAPLLAARFPRAFLDLNREPYELDPRLFCEPLPDFANAQSTRVIGGLGTVARIVADGEEIYRTPPTLAAALQRIELLYKPFHAELSAQINQTVQRFGYAVLLDCHSMPSMSIAAGPGGRPDIVLGDRFGASCAVHVTSIVKRHLEDAGYSVHINRPYAGGYITEHYGRPRRSVHAIQIEINRGLYLDEASLTRNRHFDQLRNDLERACDAVFAEVPMLLGRQAAAE